MLLGQAGEQCGLQLGGVRRALASGGALADTGSGRWVGGSGGRRGREGGVGGHEAEAEAEHDGERNKHAPQTK